MQTATVDLDKRTEELAVVKATLEGRCHELDTSNTQLVRSVRQLEKDLADVRREYSTTRIHAVREIVMCPTDTAVHIANDDTFGMWRNHHHCILLTYSINFVCVGLYICVCVMYYVSVNLVCVLRCVLPLC